MINNRDLFKKTYAEQLRIAREKYPDLYVWPIDQLEDVTKRMFLAIDKGSFNKDSLAFKWTCKALKIKHTYRDIENFLGSQGASQ